MFELLFLPRFLGTPIEQMYSLARKGKEGCTHAFQADGCITFSFSTEPKTQAFHINPEVGNKYEWKKSELLPGVRRQSLLSRVFSVTRH